MPPILGLYDDADTPLASAGASITLTPGARSAELEVRVWNDLGGGGGATASSDISMRVLARYAGDVEYLADGIPAVAQRRVEARVLGGLGGLSLSVGAYEPIGSGRHLELPGLAAGEGVRVGLSIVAPADQPALDAELSIGLYDDIVTSLPSALSATVGDGVWHGLGDGTSSGLMVAGTVDPAATPDDTVTLAGVWGWIAAGTPYTLRDIVQALGADDGDGVTLSPGEAYWARLYLDADGLLGIVRGSLGSDPLDDSAAPDYPDDVEPVARVYRDHGAAIGADDIVLEHALAYAGATTSGLTLQIGRSAALVDDRWIDAPADQITLDASSTSTVYRMPAGDLSATTDGSRPAPRGLALYQATTNASTITSVQRLHPWLPRLERVTLRLGTLSGSAQALTPSPATETPAMLLPYGRALFVVLDDLGDGSATSGAVELELEWADPTSLPLSWTSLLDVTDRPTVAYDATSLVAPSVTPDLCVIPAGALLRARQVGAFDAGHPAGATVTLWIVRS